MSEHSERSSLADGIARLARLDIPGGGQVTVEEGYAYIGHMSPPDGTTIIDVRDPRDPKIVARIPPPDQFSHSHKVRVAGDLMITNVERHRRHFYRKGDQLASLEAGFLQTHGRAGSDAEIAAALGIGTDDLGNLREGLARGYSDGGFRVWDIRDRANPELLAYVKTGGVGVHRFDMDEDYAYISTEMEGYVGNILIIYDLGDPRNPREVGRWWIPGQHRAAGEVADWNGQRNRLHHALRQGNTLWAACWYGGAYAIDISDITKPKTIGHYNYHPPFPEPTHTVFRLPDPVDGRDIVLMVDEEHDHVPGQPHGFLWIVDAADPSDMKPVSTFHVSERDSPYARAGGRFGAHQFAERSKGTLVYAAWFAGGLRVIDIADPALPREVAFYIPEPFPGCSSPQSNDVDVDERGYIYLLDRDRGLEILEMTPTASNQP